MHQNAHRVSLHSHLLGDFLVSSLLDADQPKCFGLSIGHVHHFTAHPLDKLLETDLLFSRLSRIANVLNIPTRRGLPLASPQLIDRPSSRQPSQQRAPIVHGPTSAALNRFCEHVLEAIKRVVLMSEDSRNSPPNHGAVRFGNLVPVGQLCRPPSFIRIGVPGRKFITRNRKTPHRKRPPATIVENGPTRDDDQAGPSGRDRKSRQSQASPRSSLPTNPQVASVVHRLRSFSARSGGRVLSGNTGPTRTDTHDGLA